MKPYFEGKWCAVFKPSKCITDILTEASSLSDLLYIATLSVASSFLKPAALPLSPPLLPALYSPFRPKMRVKVKTTLSSFPKHINPHLCSFNCSTRIWSIHYSVQDIKYNAYFQAVWFCPESCKILYIINSISTLSSLLHFNLIPFSSFNPLVNTCLVYLYNKGMFNLPTSPSPYSWFFPLIRLSSPKLSHLINTLTLWPHFNLLLSIYLFPACFNI